MFCTTIIPTINRSTLSRAVCSVLNQVFTCDEFEVIVINDSGTPLPDMDWQCSGRVRVIDTNRRERSVARNTGAAIAGGRFLHFLDDDDELLPGAFQAFWELGRATNAAWLYGSYQTVDNDGNLVEEYHPGLSGDVFAPLLAGESIPLQASLLEARQFYASGTFDPAITGVEDRDLCRRFALASEVAWTAAVVAKIRIGEAGSTTNWSLLAESDRCGREKALNLRNALARSLDSANSSYWHGRVSRAYCASTVWNIKNRNLLTAVSRASSAAVMTGWRFLAPDFWRGLGTRPP